MPDSHTNPAPPAVSVVMPVYNAQETLAPAVQSILEQTLADYELIIVDDGSTDTSLDIARAFAARDDRIRVFEAGRAGIVAALQSACRVTRAAYIARMDADDVALPDRLAAQQALLDSDPEMALCGTGVRTTGTDVGPGRQRYERWINRLVAHDDIVREIYVECPIAHPTFLIRRDAFEAVGGYRDDGWAEDYDLVLRLHQAGYRFGKVEDLLLEWHDHPKRLSMTSDRYSPERFRALKRHYLFEGPLAFTTKTTPWPRRFIQWGAGKVGKKWLREWDPIRPEAVVDINPRKIGRRIHGFPVIDADDLPPAGQCFVPVAVGAPGARNAIRQWFTRRGYTESRDYLFVA